MYSFNSKPQSNEDTIAPESPSNLSSLSYSDQKLLVTASWDGNSCVWADSGSTLQGKTKTKFDAPLLDVEWIGNCVAFASCDKNGWLWDVATNNRKQFALHDAPIRKVNGIKDQPSMVITGGWDATLRYWDLRKKGEALKCNVRERVYAMDSKGCVLAVGTANQGVEVFDIRKPNNPVKAFASPLRLQTKCISIFNELNGLCLGSIEGRIGVKYFDNDNNSFNFKAHREKVMGSDVEKATSVNAIAFHPRFKTFVSCGSDGIITIWDKTAKHKIKSFQKLTEAIVDVSFSKDGTSMAYAMSYDYGQGKDMRNHESGKVYVKRLNEMDFRGK